MSVDENLLRIKKELPPNLVLVAVSKTHPAERVMEAYEAGQRVFGENRVQELVEKYEQLPKDIEWHQIGHLQKNKVKYIAPFVGLIHAVDSKDLLDVIEKEGSKNNRVIPCLIQLHIANEASKFGFSYDEARAFFHAYEGSNYPHVSIRGLMAMATFTEDSNQISNEFEGLKSFYDEIKRKYFSDDKEFDVLSMGMSSDYELAIKEGSTMIRVGSAIFGSR
ncbi:MAG: YggS family pyridoxal phosphate-dependent enzyme [Bacteroidia bacterium]